MDPAATLPLNGVRVFEFGSNVAGPYAGWILARLGAEVIKIERPGGDDARSWGPPFWNGASTMFETVLGWMTLHVTGFQATGEVPTRRGTEARGVVPYQGYRCADGWLTIAASNDRLFAHLAGAVGHPEWTEDERFRTNPRRVEHHDELDALLEAVLSTSPRAVWREKLEAAGVPSSPIQSVDEVLEHRQTTATGMLPDTGIGEMNLPGLPLSLDGQRPPLRSLAPELKNADRHEVESRAAPRGRPDETDASS